MSADGSDQHRVASGCCFDWSPDGRRIAFANGGIHVINVDGTGQRMIADENLELCCELEWSPDGRRIAFTGWRGGIWVAKVDGAGATRLTAGDDSSPRWSPDGRTLLFTRHARGALGNDLFMIAVNASRVQRLTAGFFRAAAEASWWAPWSPDGLRLTVAGQPESNDEIYVMNFDGSDEQNITQTPGMGEEWPSWSPKGDSIAFTSGRTWSRVRAIHTIRADGRRHRNLGAGTQPSWSRDGANIVFIRARGSQSDIYVMTAAGAMRTKLTDTPAREIAPAWSP